MKLFCFYCIVLFQWITYAGWAQSNTFPIAQSLQSYRRATNDNQRLEILKQLFAYYRPIHIDSAQIILNWALPIARRANDRKAEVFFLTKQGTVYRMNKANPKTGLAVYLQALRLAEAIQDSAAFSDIYYGMGRIHDDFQNREEAEKAFLAAIQSAKTGVALYNGLESLAVHYANHNDLTKSENYFLQAEALINRSTDLTNYRLRFYGNIGEFYSKYKRDTTKSLSYFRQATLSSVTDPQIDLTRYLVECHGLAMVFLDLKDYKNCISVCRKVIKYRTIAKHNVQLNIAKCYLHMFRSYKALGDYRQAAFYADSAQVLSDSLTKLVNSENIKKETYKLEAAFNLERKQKEVELLTQKQKIQQLWVWTAVLVAVLLSVFSWILYRNRQNLAKQKAELTRLNTTKDKLFAILSHDLRSPVANLENNVMLTNWGALNQEEFTESTQSLGQEIGQVRTMLDNVLHWSISQMGGMRPKIEKVPVAPLIEAQLDLLLPLSKTKGIELINHISPDVTVKADKNHLAIIFRNILQNAIKFTDTGGKITLYSAEKERFVIFNITDTGIGMSQEQLDYLFQLDKSGSRTATAQEQGTGLGLVLVKELVEANGGTINVTSEINQGTSFVIGFKK